MELELVYVVPVPVPRSTCHHATGRHLLSFRAHNLFDSSVLEQIRSQPSADRGSRIPLYTFD